MLEFINYSSPADKKWDFQWSFDRTTKRTILQVFTAQIYNQNIPAKNCSGIDNQAANFAFEVQKILDYKNLV